MTEFEKYFVLTHRKLNALGLRHWLVGSSLLGPLREGHLIEGDMEVNFGVMFEDLANAKPSLYEHYQVKLSHNFSLIPGAFLLDKDWPKDKNIWEHPVGFTWLAPHKVSGNKVIQFVDKKHIFYWNTEDLLPTQKIVFMDELFEIPAHPEKWLEDYYGEGWKTRDPNWHWLTHAKNHIDFEGFIK